MSATLSANPAGPCLEDDRFRLVWRLTGWRLSRQFHGSTERSLRSPVYHTPGCSWQMEFQLEYKSGNGQEHCELRVGLHLFDCDITPSSVIISGQLRVAASASSPSFVTRKLDGNFMIGETRYCQWKYASAFSDTITITAEFHVYAGVTSAHSDNSYEYLQREKSRRQQSGHLVSALDALLDSSDLHDLIIDVDGTTVYGHKAVFAARSPVFRELFEKAKNAKRTYEMTIPDCGLECWNLFHRYLYTGKIDESLENDGQLCSALFKLGDEYGVESLKDHLIARLTANLDQDNALDVMEIAFKFGVRQLQEASLQFVQLHLNHFKTEKNSELLTNIKARPELALVLLEAL